MKDDHISGLTGWIMTRIVNMDGYLAYVLSIEKNTSKPRLQELNLGLKWLQFALLTYY